MSNTYTSYVGSVGTYMAIFILPSNYYKKCKFTFLLLHIIKNIYKTQGVEKGIEKSSKTSIINFKKILGYIGRYQIISKIIVLKMIVLVK